MGISLLLEYDSRQQLREWLLKNHDTARECWVTCNRGKQPRPGTIFYEEIVEEALCFGWIDSTLKRLPDGRLAQRISPRRKNSHWTQLNLDRCARLSAMGLMTEAGLSRLPSNHLQGTQAISNHLHAKRSSEAQRGKKPFQTPAGHQTTSTRSDRPKLSEESTRSDRPKHSEERNHFHAKRSSAHAVIVPLVGKEAQRGKKQSQTTSDSSDIAYCFFHQKLQVYAHSTMEWQRDDIEQAIADYVQQMDPALYDWLSQTAGCDDFLLTHSRFQQDLTTAVTLLENR